MDGQLRDGTKWLRSSMTGTNLSLLTKAKFKKKRRSLRDYKMLKEAKKQSGCSWNEKRCMIEGEPSLWENLIVVR